MNDITTYDSECFTIGNCEYPASIEYTACSEGDITIHSCMIEVADADFTCWAKVDREYFPVIEVELKRALTEDAERERNEFFRPDEELPYFLRRQAS